MASRKAVAASKSGIHTVASRKYGSESRECPVSPDSSMRVGINRSDRPLLDAWEKAFFPVCHGYVSHDSITSGADSKWIPAALRTRPDHWQHVCCSGRRFLILPELRFDSD